MKGFKNYILGTFSISPLPFFVYVLLDYKISE